MQLLNKKKQGGGRLRGNIAKKTASVLAAVAVAGGSAVTGMPAAEALSFSSALYFEKSDEDGNPLGGSVWKIQFEEFHPGRWTGDLGAANVTYYTYYVVDDFGDEDKKEWRERYSGTGLKWEYEFLKSEYGIDDKSFIYGRKGYPGVEEPRPSMDEVLQLQPVQDFVKSVDTDFVRDGHNSDVSGSYWPYGEYTPEQVLKNDLTDLDSPTLDHDFTDTELITDRNDLPGRIKTWGLYGIDSNLNLGSPDWKLPRASDIRIEEVVPPKGYGTCGASSEKPEAAVSLKSSGGYDVNAEINSVTSSGSLPYTELAHGDEENFGTVIGVRGTYPVANFINCKVPEPTTVTETVTETPEPSTTTVTPPTTTVTLPSTVTTTVTPPAVTVTETPKTETTTATTTESATATVTETPQTETVTETPQRETVTETPAPKTETVTETPKKETVTETPKTETVTHTPDKETVTETPKVSTETKTSTVTAPHVTVTETSNQVTETITLPQKTVTQQVPTTVVKNKTEIVKEPVVTVTETEKQEPVTVTATPEKITETVEVPSEETTVVVTEPSEPSSVSDSSPVKVSVPVETTTSSLAETSTVAQPSETSTPVPEAKNTTSRVLASTGANVAGLAVLAGLLVGLGVFVTRRKK